LFRKRSTDPRWRLRKCFPSQSSNCALIVGELIDRRDENAAEVFAFLMAGLALFCVGGPMNPVHRMFNGSFALKVVGKTVPSRCARRPRSRFSGSAGGVAAGDWSLSGLTVRPALRDVAAEY
jgi:hypothetical protein